MKRVVMPIVSTALLISMVCSSGVYAANEQIDTAANVGVQYKTHIQDKGWESNWISDGNLSGTVGEGKRLEGLRVELVGSVPVTANIQTYVHVQNRGDMGPFPMGNMAGTEGQGLRLESIRLVLNNLPGYTIKYNVQVQNKGWLRDEDDDSTWFKSGETAGTAGQSLRLEGIRIKLVQIDENMLAYNAALAAVNEYDYTIASWADYQEVVNENIVDADNTVDEIKQATKNIIAAQGNLVKGKTMSGYIAALQAVNEADYTPASWAEYLLVLEDPENIVDQSNSQSEINKATLNIMEAQRQLQHKTNYTEYEKTLAAVRESDYTAPSWAVYQKVLAANVMTEANSQVEVDEAVKRIKLAQKKMVRKFDFTAYNALLNAVKKDDYMESSWTLYQAIVDANKVDEDNTQTDIEAAITKIEAAQKQLVKKADLKYYKAAIDAVDKNDYTTASWNAYQKEISTIIVNGTSDQAVVDAAVVNILKAQKNLVPAGDMTYYEMVLDAVIRDDYTSASWVAYQKVVAANVVIPTDGQEAINLAIQNIEAAQKKLVKGADLTAYRELLAAVNADDYTTASWATYQKVVDSNQMTGDKTQAQVDAAMEKIRQAQKKLALKGKLDLAGGYNETVASKNELEYTTASWTAYQKVLDANYMDEDKSQAQIDAAVRNIKKAQLKLTKAGDMTAYLYLMENNKNLGIPMVEGNYTSATWAAYQKILDKNEMNRDKSQKQIDTAVVAIERAQKNLKLKGDMTEYNAALALVKEADWTVASWTAYMKVVMSKENYMSGDNDEAAIKKAIGNIKLAQTTVLKKKGNVDDYNILISKYVGQSDRFKTTAWNAYMAVLTKYVMTTENTQDQIASAMTFISIAQEELLKNPAASLLEFNRVKGLVDDESAYTPESWAIYAEVVRKYQNITKDSLQTDVDKATAALENAQKNLVRQNGTELKAFQKMLELYQNNLRSTAGDFYKVSEKISNWSVYEQAVLRYADFYPEDYSWKPSNITKESSPTDIIAATKAIETAIRALRPKDNPTLSAAIVNYEAAKGAAEILGWNNPLVASTYTESSFKAFADACNANDLMNLIISANGTLITADIVNTATTGINNAMANKKPVYRATDGDIQKYQAEKNWYAEFKASYYTVALWKDYETKITKTNYDTDHPEEIVQETFVGDINSIISKREALIYNATYVMEQSRLTAANMGTFDISDGPNNVISRAEQLMIARGLEGFKISNYDVTFEQISGAGKGTATLDTAGKILTAGDGKATIKISIKALGDTTSTEIKTTGEITIDIRE
ncbi:hypothetical protein LNN31_04345 [Acetobacterium wieringae]|uniref:Uncharacterized protein n=1 Tax=Acetobacterium wieringae TaxID=52694 RepID=A0ABY6HGI8_9FIRM|nr:hypothetical protein [Acetobacterium wieringae]UYO63667.1 hypothetical protein LNN31_04345 [Acetobacterium wieringae]